MTTAIRCIRLLPPALVAVLLAGCEPQAGPRPVATLQELMDGVVDPAADAIWESVSTEYDKDGLRELQPRTPEEWQAVRRHAIALTEAANLLLLPGRRVSAREFAADATTGVSGSKEIAQAIAAEQPAFDQYAELLRTIGQQMVGAIDRRDPKAILGVGETLDAVCEACHKAFWYPNEKLPGK